MLIGLWVSITVLLTPCPIGRQMEQEARKLKWELVVRPAKLYSVPIMCWSWGWLNRITYIYLNRVISCFLECFFFFSSLGQNKKIKNKIPKFRPGCLCLHRHSIVRWQFPITVNVCFRNPQPDMHGSISIIYKVGYFDASNLLEQWFGLSACSHFLIGVLQPLGFWKESFGGSSNSTAYLCLCCNIIFHNKNLILFECKLYIVCILAFYLYNTGDSPPC